MKHFTYNYIDETGRRAVGTLEAESFEDASHALSMQKAVVLSIGEGDSAARAGPKRKRRRGKVSRRELIEFCIYLGTLSEAGLPLTSALTEFTEESQNDYFNHVVATLRDRVESGETLSQGMTDFPRVFSREFVHLIRAGEQTGTIPNSFKELRGYLEWLERLNGDIKQATTYPLFVSVALSCLVLFLFSSVVPKITQILIDMRMELPLITRIIIGISKGAMRTWHLWVAAGVIMPVAMRMLVTRSERIALLVDSYKLRLPVFGDLIRLITQARFTKNFSVLHRAGIPVIENLDMSKGFVGNRLYARTLDIAARQVQEGRTLSETLKESGLFSGLVIRMFAIGESAGRLEESLRHAADYYDEEVPRRIKRVFGILEPLIIVMLIAVIGMVALAIFLPILSISQGLRS